MRWVPRGNPSRPDQTQRIVELLSEVDLIVDTVGGDVLERSWPVLAPDGRLVSVALSSRCSRAATPAAASSS